MSAPAWLADLVARRQRRLGLCEWQIEVEVSPTPGGSATNRANTLTTPARSYALLTFREDLADDAATVQTIDHELLHVAHARVTQFVRGVLIPELTPASQALARQAYRDVMEPFIDRLATVLADAKD